MFTVEEEESNIYTVKNSKFISYIFPIKVYEGRLKQLKKEHSKANHIVVAYRKIENESIQEFFTDDGEVSGTAGKPTLLLLQGKNLINVALITVRYFGGIKLGKSGLVKAYTQSAKLVLEKVKLVKYIQTKKISLQVSYGDIRKVFYEVEKLDGKILEQNYLDNKVNFTILLEKEKVEEFLKNWRR